MSFKYKQPRKAVIVALSALVAVAIIVSGVFVYAHIKNSTEQPTAEGTDTAQGAPPSGTGGTGKSATGQPVPATPATEANKSAAAPSATGSNGGPAATSGSGSSSGSGGASGTSGGSSGGSATTCSGTHVAGGSDGAGGCWPGASNTGVPAGVVLTAYSGPTTITTPNTVISGKLVNDDLIIQTSNVTIRNSRINGHIDSDGASYSVTIEDSEVHASTTSSPAIGYSNLTIRRVEITGGQHSVLCGGNCTVTDSWLHDQYNKPNDAFHNNAFLSNGGSNMTLEHNTLHCSPEDNNTGGGCTTNATFLGDFAVIADVTVNRNLFVATPAGYCGTFGYNPGKTYGSNPTNVSVTNNIFQRGSNNKCGGFGPATSFLAANGNVWNNNKFTDGGAVTY